jgi:hypothetical protein
VVTFRGSILTGGADGGNHGDVDAVAGGTPEVVLDADPVGAGAGGVVVEPERMRASAPAHERGEGHAGLDDGAGDAWPAWGGSAALAVASTHELDPWG